MSTRRFDLSCRKCGFSLSISSSDLRSLYGGWLPPASMVSDALHCRCDKGHRPGIAATADGFRWTTAIETAPVGTAAIRAFVPRRRLRAV